MAIDLGAIAYNMHPELKSYTGISQLIEANQDIPPDELIYPRMTWNWTIKYTPEARQSIIANKAVVASDDPNFDKDIEYSYITVPRVTLSINVFGDDVSQYINKAREWFTITQLGPRFLEDYNAVVKEVTNTQDRKTFLETDYEDRQGFDVILSIEETIKVIEKTIEQVEITDQDGNTKIYDL